MAARNMNYEQFDKAVLEDKPLLVDYWAPWCGYCRRIGPAYDALAKEYEGQVDLVKINIDEEPDLARQEQIEVIPTLVLYRGGEALGSIVAPGSKAMIDEFIRNTLNP